MNRALTILFALVVLFVVVCPATPTPIAVVSVRSVQTFLPFAAILVFAAGLVLTATRTELVFQNECQRRLVRENVLELTCTLLC